MSQSIAYPQYSDGRYRLTLAATGNSEAIWMPPRNVITIMLSDITAAVTLQYSLSSKKEMKAGNARWHDMSYGELTASRGIVIDTPTQFIRVRAAADATYTVEVLT